MGLYFFTFKSKQALLKKHYAHIFIQIIFSLKAMKLLMHIKLSAIKLLNENASIEV